MIDVVARALATHGTTPLPFCRGRVQVAYCRQGGNPDRHSAIQCYPFQEKFLIAANHEQVFGHNRADTATSGLEIASMIMQLALRT
ncbi:MAG: hypothetical protein F4X92_05860 [Gammaproteobacteria bacterium]|nr:hypothetical protein [Gammaproteobacteria bacterium]